MADSRLDAAGRQRSIARMEGETLDVLVIGGGITGTGAALDAAGRGFSVGLLEKDDLASGTSSRSSKLIHGGLRYLERLDFGLVREALGERGLLLHHLAPHLVTPVAFVLPLRHRLWERAYVGAGTWLYDRLGGTKHLPPARHLSRQSVERLAPGLRRSSFIGGIQFWDAQTDDARYVVSVARTAAAHGALIATRVRATDPILEGGRISGVRAVDSESGRTISIRARHVVAAVGPWSDHLFEARHNPRSSPASLRPSKGVHVLLPRDAVRTDTGLLARTRTGLLFVIPWEGHWLVGDTDTEWNGAPEDAVTTREDISALLERLESQLGTRADATRILGVFAGVRPLAAAEPGSTTVQLSREHVIRSPQPGLTTISGGKFTTYRVMAEQLIDAVAEDLGCPQALSRSAATPLVGATGFTVMWRDRQHLAHAHGLPVAHVDRLLRRYGTCTTELLELVDTRPELGEVVHGTENVLAAEVVYGCTHEGARHLDDVLTRRTRIGVLTPEKGEAAIDAVSALIAETLGWEHHDVERERHDYLAAVASERRAVAELASTDV